MAPQPPPPSQVCLRYCHSTPWSTLNSPATAASQEKCGPRRIQFNSTHNEILGGKCSSSQYFRPSFEPKLLVDYYLFIFLQPHWLLKSISDYVLLTIGLWRTLTWRHSTQALLELEPPSGQFFPCFVGEESGQQPAQRANVALIPAAIKSSHLITNTNRPEGISAFPVSPYHQTHQTHYF